MTSIAITRQRRTAMVLTLAALTALTSCGASTGSPYRTFASPEHAVQVLIETVNAGAVPQLVQIFGPEGQALIDSSDPAAARRNREVFLIAVAERWRLADQPAGGKVLVIGNEEWPFPVPLIQEQRGWRFDAAAGLEEVIARRIGRNEMAAIQVCRAYVRAQRLYAQRPRDGHAAGLYAKTFRSDPGRQNGLYWPVARGEKRSPLGDLLAEAAEARRLPDRPGPTPAPFHGYYFAVLTAQGAAAPGGAKPYVVGDEMSGGFALVAWPARYDVTGVMTFIVNQDGIVHQRDLGADTEAAATGMVRYDPDASWTPAQ